MLFFFISQYYFFYDIVFIKIKEYSNNDNIPRFYHTKRMMGGGAVVGSGP